MDTTWADLFAAYGADGYMKDGEDDYSADGDKSSAKDGDDNSAYRSTVHGPLFSRQTIDFDNEGDLWLDVGGDLSDGGEEEAEGGNDDDDRRDEDEGSAVGAMIDHSGWCGDGYQEGAEGRHKNELPKRPRGVYRFRVCSRTMRRASPVWKAMLFGPWLERKPANEEEWVVALPDDPPVATAVLLAIVHGRTDLVPTWSGEHVHHASFEAISSILSAADKYDLLHLFSPFVHEWIQHTKPAHYACSEDDPLGPLNRLDIAWQLGQKDVVMETIGRFIFELPGDRLKALLAAAEDGPRIGMSLSLRDVFRIITDFWQGLTQSALDYFHELMDTLSNDNRMMDGLVPGTDMLCVGNIFGAVNTDAIERRMVLYFKNSLVITELRKRHALERRRCNACVFSEILRGVPTEGFPKGAKDVHISLDDLLDSIGCALGESHDLKPVPLPGHEWCHRKAKHDFSCFRIHLKNQFFPWCSVKLLEPEQVDRLRNRADILRTWRVELEWDFCSHAEKHGYP